MSHHFLACLFFISCLMLYLNFGSFSFHYVAKYVHLFLFFSHSGVDCSQPVNHPIHVHTTIMIRTVCAACYQTSPMRRRRTVRPGGGGWPNRPQRVARVPRTNWSRSRISRTSGAIRSLSGSPSSGRAQRSTTGSRISCGRMWMRRATSCTWKRSGRCAKVN